MPGIENFAPERTERRRGFFGSPNVLPWAPSTSFSAASISAISPSGSFLPSW